MVSLGFAECLVTARRTHQSPDARWHTLGTLVAHLALQKHLATLVRRPLVCLDHEHNTAGISYVLRCLCVLWIAWASTVCQSECSAVW